MCSVRAYSRITLSWEELSIPKAWHTAGQRPSFHVTKSSSMLYDTSGAMFELTQIQDRRRTRFALILTFHHRPPPPGGTSSRHRALQASCLQTSPWRCSVRTSCCPGQTQCIYVCTQINRTDVQSWGHQPYNVYVH